MAFAGYAFNKSHAAAYAVVAYQTGWLKVHYPVELMAAMLNSYLGSLSQAASYVRVCRAMNIAVLPPDINRSQARFTTENGAIRFALAAVKNVGETAIRSLIAEREKNGPFGSFGDLMRRMDESTLNRKMVESLIRASALDGFGVPRAQMIAVIEPFSNRLASSRRQSMEGQLSLFDLGTVEQVTEAEPEYPALSEFTQREKLSMEKEMLGLYISGHPLDEYERAISTLTSLDSAAFAPPPESDDEGLHPPALTDNDRVIMAGMLVGRKNKTTRSNELMSFLTLEDLAGIFEVIVFPRVLGDCQALLGDGTVLLVGGRLSIREDDQPKLIAEQIAVLEPGMRQLPPGFELRRMSARSPARDADDSRERPPEEAVVQEAARRPARAKLCIRYHGLEEDAGYKRLLAMLNYFQGAMPVRIYLDQEDRLVDLGPRYAVAFDDDVLKRLAERCGSQNLALTSE